MMRQKRRKRRANDDVRVKDANDGRGVPKRKRGQGDDGVDGRLVPFPRRTTSQCAAR